MKNVVVLVALLAGCARPLAPGETRCRSSNVYGTTYTNCRTGQPAYQPQYAAPQRPLGFWCTSVPGFGVCTRDPGPCENARAAVKDGSASACQWQGQAICSSLGCFTDPASCGDSERREGRDASACRALQ